MQGDCQRLAGFKAMKLSVIIPSLDGEHRFAMPARIPNGLEVELVVVKGVAPVCEARNQGLAKASGDYIAWVDADDDVSEDWLTEISSALQSEPDIVSFNAKVEWLDRRKKNYIIGGAAYPADVMSENAAGQLWNKVIRRTLFEGLRFKNAVHEDYRLLCELLPRAKNIKHINKTLYVYRRRPDGLSQYANNGEEIKSLNELIAICGNLTEDWQRKEMSKGVALRVADFCRHAKSTPEMRRFLRTILPLILFDRQISVRIKIKVLLAALGM